jgi:hypothetical protein
MHFVPWISRVAPERPSGRDAMTARTLTIEMVSPSQNGSNRAKSARIFWFPFADPLRSHHRAGYSPGALKEWSGIRCGSAASDLSRGERRVNQS